LDRAPFPAAGGAQAAALQNTLPLPRPAMPEEAPREPLVTEANGEDWPTSEEWNRLFRAVMSQDSILRERGRGLSRRRSLQSLIAQLRDRDLLYEKGKKMGEALYSASYSELSEKLVKNGICTDAQFGRPTAGGDGLEITLTGTAMSRGVPRIGACICYLEAGLLAGALRNIERQDLAVNETLCVAKGDPYCAFRAHAAAKPDGGEAALPAFSPPTPSR
ncbi:MAG TPA: V4R domain-containing protein, partial [Candidatus Thermoplasmatota archaeon]|nr:V4R domain-containing protein [Candidatus Thermoplasmatota archaeon]